jgi:hypothetical protein
MTGLTHGGRPAPEPNEAPAMPCVVDLVGVAVADGFRKSANVCSLVGVRLEGSGRGSEPSSFLFGVPRAARVDLARPGVEALGSTLSRCVYRRL